MRFPLFPFLFILSLSLSSYPCGSRFCLCMCRHITHHPASRIIFYALLNDITFFCNSIRCHMKLEPLFVKCASLIIPFPIILGETTNCWIGWVFLCGRVLTTHLAGKTVLFNQNKRVLGKIQKIILDVSQLDFPTAHHGKIWKYSPAWKIPLSAFKNIFFMTTPSRTHHSLTLLTQQQPPLSLACINSRVSRIICHHKGGAEEWISTKAIFYSFSDTYWKDFLWSFAVLCLRVNFFRDLQMPLS